MLQVSVMGGLQEPAPVSQARECTGYRVAAFGDFGVFQFFESGRSFEINLPSFEERSYDVAADREIYVLLDRVLPSAKEVVLIISVIDLDL
jgi:hypothetical protein